MRACVGGAHGGGTAAQAPMPEGRPSLSLCALKSGCVVSLFLSLPKTAPMPIGHIRAMICAEMKRASSSFYWGMRMLPPARRNALFAVYLFCRSVDDIADDLVLSTEEKQNRLEEWRREIDALYAGHPQSPLAEVLWRDVCRFSLARDDFMDMIAGMEMDVEGPIVAPSLEVLDLYCDRVASSVGRLALRIFGETSSHAHDLAHHLGRALQLANILRDVDEDAAMGRVYVPLEILRAHGVVPTPPSSIMRNLGFAAAWRELADVADFHFKEAEACLGRCHTGDLTAAAIMGEAYFKNLERMKALSDSELSNPAVSKRLLGKWELMWIALKHKVWGR